MPFKPNYNHQRSERARAKERKKLEKLQRRDDEAARRKAALDAPPTTDIGATSPDDPEEKADGPQETTP